MIFNSNIMKYVPFVINNTEDIELSQDIYKVGEQVFTTSEVADMLKVKQRTIYNWIDNKELHCTRLGGKGSIRITQSELERFVNNTAHNRVGTP